MDECGCYCQFQWLEGPKINQTTCCYTPESFKPLLPMENKETFKDQKGTFHYEPVVWGDWGVGDEIIFEGYNSTKDLNTGVMNIQEGILMLFKRMKLGTLAP